MTGWKMMGSDKDETNFIDQMPEKINSESDSTKNRAANDVPTFEEFLEFVLSTDLQGKQYTGNIYLAILLETKIYLIRLSLHSKCIGFVYLPFIDLF